MLRNNWKFKVTLKVLAEAVSAKLGYHTDKVEEWGIIRKDTLGEIKDTGITIEEQHYTGGADVVLKAKTELSKKLSRADQRLKHHKQAKDEIERWQRVIESDKDKDRVFELDFDDVVYFEL